ncbi:transcriptional regulator [Aliivibrio fischeri]|uniref:phage regulatory CII family protein n=1 Tax=Aliivibrio fischeri TaxID=668 RepID=UPI0012D8FC3B|nr:phage regulatory CII family protein [Aliivibrio fischeri]MUH96373.1 transcriptional regulator [Aliivibrio fischeri]MUI63943.1 transcriptional regulator [Aliivibrio fischeri]
MEDISTTYVFQKSKQQAFDDACLAFRQNNNMRVIAEELDMTPALLRSKLNVEQSHVLSCVEMVMVAKVSGDYTIVNCLLRGLGVVTANVPTDASEETFAKRALENSMHAGDLAKEALDHVGQTRITHQSKQTIIKKAQASIGNLVLLINDIEGRTPNAVSYLSMGVDFITSGAPLPGFA